MKPADIQPSRTSPNGSSPAEPSYSTTYFSKDAGSGSDEDEEPFVYPGAEPEAVEEQPPSQSSPIPSPLASNPTPSTAVSSLHADSSPAPSAPSAPLAAQPSPAQLEALYAAASSGDLQLLQSIFRNASESDNVAAFSLANDASSRTGLTVLHAAASRGYIAMVKWRKWLSCSLYIARG